MKQRDRGDSKAALSGELGYPNKETSPVLAKTNEVRTALTSSWKFFIVESQLSGICRFLFWSR